MQRTAQAALLLKGCSLLGCLRLEQVVLAEFIFIGGVFHVVSCRMASAVRAAADWQALGTR